MKVVCDADGLIKMAKAGILETFAAEVELLVGPQVYHEAVEEGQARGHPDAFALERILKDSASRRQTQHRDDEEAASLGAGEREAIALYYHEKADVVLSDDRGFLNMLTARQIPYLTPAAVLVFLVERGVLTGEAAHEALERLRPLIRQEQYKAVRQDLQALTERGDGR